MILLFSDDALKILALLSRELYLRLNCRERYIIAVVLKITLGYTKNLYDNFLNINYQKKKERNERREI